MTSARSHATVAFCFFFLTSFSQATEIIETYDEETNTYLYTTSPPKNDVTAPKAPTEQHQPVDVTPAVPLPQRHDPPISRQQEPLRPSPSSRTESGRDSSGLPLFAFFLLAAIAMVWVVKALATRARKNSRLATAQRSYVPRATIPARTLSDISKYIARSSSPPMLPGAETAPTAVVALQMVSKVPEDIAEYAEPNESFEPAISAISAEPAVSNESNEIAATTISDVPEDIAESAEIAVSDAVKRFIGSSSVKTIIVVDLETNGLHPPQSVLSCSAIKYSVDPVSRTMEEIDRFTRYYLPKERVNRAAIAVNGLTRERIIRLRNGAAYPKYFLDDSGFQEFCSDVDGMVAHRAAFELRFLSFFKKPHFCTMLQNTDIVRAGFMEWKGGYKWPTLAETANFYGVSLDGEFHDSNYDCEVTARIFKVMIKRMH